jgi:renalase
MRVAVVGAGVSGLMAANAVTARGHEAIVLERGRSVGGRLATRRIGAARLDHGAQFFTVRDDSFASHVREWVDSGVVYEWCRGFQTDDGYPRYAVRGGMNALAKHLARGVDVRTNSMAFSFHRTGRAASWDVKLDDGSLVHADALIVTCPLPQTFSLLVSAEVQMPEVLWRTDYDRTLALLAVLDGPSSVPAPGGVQSDPTFTFIADNQAKGISRVPSITLHANPAWSGEHWDDATTAIHHRLIELAQPWIGAARIIESHVKRWRFATPQRIWPDAHWSPEDLTSLAVAGDAFAGPKVEGAALSGLSAAAAVTGGKVWS